MSLDSHAEPLGSPQGWTLIFTVIAYLMVLASIFGAVRKGLEVKAPTRPLHGVLEQLAVLGLLILAFWGLESLAHLRAPYYVYSVTFSDLLPRAPFPQSWAAEITNPCTRYVSGHSVGIPLSVIVLEASLTYSALWTARMSGVALWVQPLFAGLSMCLVDLLLDPVVAMGHDCSARALPEVGNGLGLWHWLSPQVGDLASEGDHLLALYFHIPLFNYAAWLGAPIIALAVINIGPFTRDWAAPQFLNTWAKVRGQQPARVPSPRDGGQHLAVFSWLVLFGGLFLVVTLGPAQNPRPATQVVLVVTTLVVALVCLALQLGKLKSVDRVDATLTTPLALALAVPSAAGLIGGQFVSTPWLMPVAVTALAGGLWLGWWPYSKSLKVFQERLKVFDSFVRLHYFGFTGMLVLLGASFFEQTLPSSVSLLLLLVLAACFHVFSYVLNDLVDLEHDKGQELRKESALASGRVKVPVAVALTVTSVPCAFLTLYHLQGFRAASVWGFYALAFAFGCMTIYNCYGKRCPWPWVTDLVQAIAWGTLAFVGASTRATETKPVSFFDAVDRCAPLFLYGALFIFLINGIHGGLRDLRNDSTGKKSTLAICLGARPQPGGRVESTWRVLLFASLVHAAMLSCVLWFLYRENKQPAPERYASSASVSTVLLLCVLTFAVSAHQLWHVVRIHEPRRNSWISWNLPVLLLPPIIVFWGAAKVDLAFKITATLWFFVPLLCQDEIVAMFVKWAYDSGDGLSLFDRLRARWRQMRSDPPDSDRDAPLSSGLSS